MVLGTIFLLAALHNPGQLGRRIYGFLQFAAAATGIGIAIGIMLGAIALLFRRVLR